MGVKLRLHRAMVLSALVRGMTRPPFQWVVSFT